MPFIPRNEQSHNLNDLMRFLVLEIIISATNTSVCVFFLQNGIKEKYQLFNCNCCAQKPLNNNFKKKRFFYNKLTDKYLYPKMFKKNSYIPFVFIQKLVYIDKH